MKPPPLPLTEPNRAEHDRKIVEASGHRLLGSAQSGSSDYRRILARAHEIISTAEAARRAVEETSATLRQTRLPLGILSIVEYEALIRVAVELFWVPSCELVFLILIFFLVLGRRMQATSKQRIA